MSTKTGDDHPYPDNRIWYWRYDRATAGPWTGPVIIDTTSVLGYTIDASNVSGKVAIAYIASSNLSGYNGRNNVAYQESGNSGLSWIAGSVLGPATRNIITNYSDTLGPQAWGETSIAYDHNATLHIIYTEQRMPQSEQMAIKHWSSDRGTLETITEAYYDNPNFWGRSTNISHISLGVGDGTTSCGTGDNTDYLYVMYTKLGGETAGEQSDISLQGFANGELYLTGSPNGGIDWSQPINLTNTKSPNCTSTNPDSLCASEAWGTLARDVSDIEIIYIRDYEAGYFGESGWSINHVMYLNIPGGTLDHPLLCPNIPCECPCHADPQCDGSIDVLDVVQVINIAFRNATSTTGPACGKEQSDVNCSGFTDVLDVVKVINVAFRNADPAGEFCDPCL